MHSRHAPPNMRLKLAALRLKEALCCLTFGASAAAQARSVRQRR